MWIKLWPARRLDEDGGSGYKAAKYTQHLWKAFSGRGGTQRSSVCAYVKCVRALLWLGGVFSGCQSQAVSQKLLASTQAVKLWCFRRVQGFGKTQNSVLNRHWGCPYLSKLGVRSLEFFILFFPFPFLCFLLQIPVNISISFCLFCETVVFFSYVFLRIFAREIRCPSGQIWSLEHALVLTTVFTRGVSCIFVRVFNWWFCLNITAKRHFTS